MIRINMPIPQNIEAYERFLAVIAEAIALS
jgi:hypothetical protein